MSNKKVYILIDVNDYEFDRYGVYAFDSEDKLRKGIENIIDLYNLENGTSFTNLEELNDNFDTDFTTHEVEVK